MGEHSYTNPGAAPKVEVLRASFTATTVRVELRDGSDELRLWFSDLDTLRGVRCAFNEALGKLIAALLDDAGETVPVRDLEEGDQAVIDGDLVTIDTVVIDGARVCVRYLDAQDDPNSVIFAVDATIDRLMAPTLTAVR